MRARDFLVEYDRSRTLAMLTDRQIINRLKPHDWRTLYAHWDGREIRPSGHYDHPSDELRRYCEKAVGALKLDMSKDNFEEDGAVTYADPKSEFWGYWRWVKEFIMDLCEQADPTKKRKFAPTILRWWYQGHGMNYLEDIYKAKDALETYIKFKNRIAGLDLNQINFFDFANRMDEIGAIPSGSEEDRAMQQGFFDRDEAKLVIDDAQVRVVVPLTKEAAQYFGRNTRWCTSAKENNMFASYSQRGPLFIVLFKAENRRWQWHFEDGQFMDARDEPNENEIHETLPHYPELMDLWDNCQRSILEQAVSRSASDWAIIHAIKFMFRPTLQDYQKGIESCESRATRIAELIKGDSWALIHPMQNMPLIKLVRKEWWFDEHGNLNMPDELPSDEPFRK